MKRNSFFSTPLFFAIWLSMMGNCLSAQIAQGLLVHYPFNGNTLDASGNAYHGTVNGNAVYSSDPFGNAGQAYDINWSANYIDLPSSSILQPTQFPITVSFWLNPVAHSASQAIFGTSVLTGIYSGFWVNLRSSGQIAGSIGSGTSIGSPYRHSGYSTIPLAYNQWQHVTIVFRGYSNIEIYVDCQPVSVSYDGNGSGGPVNAANAQGAIGKIASGNSWIPYNYGNCQIDEFMMWDRALSASEISTLCAPCQDDSTLVNQSICSGDSIAFGGTYLSSPGLYSMLYQNSGGCDSLFQMNLSLASEDSTFVQESICDGAQYLFNGIVLTQAGQYTFLGSNSNGCDSTSILDLSITPVDTGVISANGQLTSMQSNATYQWINCENMAPVVLGGTGRSYTPELSGSYAVVVTYNGCTDTSNCSFFSGIGVPEEESIWRISQGTQGQLQVNYAGSGSYAIQIVDMLGRTVLEEHELMGDHRILAPETSGIFIIRLSHSSTGKVKLYKWIPQ